MPSANRPRVVAILATYNERRFVAGCIEHLREQGVETYLIDNCSTDETVEIAERYGGRGLIGLERTPRENDRFDLTAQLQRKEQLAGELEADWFIHLDADELRLPPQGWGTLPEAFDRVESEGYNAVNFLELTFVPTREEPDHDHSEFQRTLRTYYPFEPAYPHQLKAWRAAAAPSPDLASSAGHRVDFPGLRMHPKSFPMKHYLFLSLQHAREKYVARRYDPEEVASGWHGWRARVRDADIRLPLGAELRHTRFDADLDPSGPWKKHWLDFAHLHEGAGG
jgi:glycosyltransferase involved in cell wall biosynthesis